MPRFPHSECLTLGCASSSATSPMLLGWNGMCGVGDCGLLLGRAGCGVDEPVVWELVAADAVGYWVMEAGAGGTGRRRACKADRMTVIWLVTACRRDM